MKTISVSVHQSKYCTTSLLARLKISILYPISTTASSFSVLSLRHAFARRHVATAVFRRRGGARIPSGRGAQVAVAVAALQSASGSFAGYDVPCVLAIALRREVPQSPFCARPFRFAREVGAPTPAFLLLPAVRVAAGNAFVFFKRTAYSTGKEDFWGSEPAGRLVGGGHLAAAEGILTVGRQTGFDGLPGRPWLGGLNA